jgi:hypothetical protein
MIKRNYKNVEVVTPTGLKTFYGISKQKKECIIINTEFNKSIVVSKFHPFIVGGDIVLSNALKKGDCLESYNGKFIKIQSIKDVGKKDVYDLVGVDGDCYFANGFLVHNCFLNSGNAAVGAEILEKFKQEKKPVIWDGEDGGYRVFELPAPNKMYVVGVDVGEGVGRASSVAQVLDVTDLQDIKQVAVYGTNKIEPYHFANKLHNLASSWGNPPILIERNNCGASVIDALYQNLHYDKIVSYSKLSNTGSFASTRHLGVYSHNNLRFASVANMRYWLNFLQVVHINDIDTIKELETFIRYPNGTYRKQSEKFYDDRVMALVWSLFILETDICQQYYQVDEYDTQNKPQVLSRYAYEDINPDTYVLRDLTSKLETSIVSPTEGQKYKSLINNDDSYNSSEDDLDSLLSNGWTYM